ncbi:MAG: response regulator transcription factor [Maledivibacter sp.]|jgi:RNA polymerase sigma factor (sigma-70 family)|nr:response regulator transcription factor [Maledivibacter sp.]
MIRVMIVDDQGLIRDGLKMILSLSEDIEVVGEAVNGEEAIDMLSRVNPDVILMDIRMPVLNGVEATKIIKEKFPAVKILILTTFNEDEYIFEGLKYGADGYMLKDVKSDEIIKAIKEVYKGNVLLQPEIATKVVRAFNNISNHNEIDDNREIEKSIKNLTPRELEISNLVADGKSNREIGKVLFITEGTVKNHLTRILGKLELRDRTQLALYINKNMK